MNESNFDEGRRQSILKQRPRLPLQEVPLFFPTDEDTTTTITHSRRVSFGRNMVKEFIVGSASSTQALHEYEQSSESLSDPSTDCSGPLDLVLNKSCFEEFGDENVAPVITPPDSFNDLRSAAPDIQVRRFSECVERAVSMLEENDNELTAIIIGSKSSRTSSALNFNTLDLSHMHDAGDSRMRLSPRSKKTFGQQRSEDLQTNFIPMRHPEIFAQNCSQSFDKSKFEFLDRPSCLASQLNDSRMEETCPAMKLSSWARIPSVPQTRVSRAHIDMSNDSDMEETCHRPLPVGGPNRSLISTSLEMGIDEDVTESSILAFNGVRDDFLAELEKRTPSKLANNDGQKKYPKVVNSLIPDDENDPEEHFHALQKELANLSHSNRSFIDQCQELSRSQDRSRSPFNTSGVLPLRAQRIPIDASNNMGLAVGDIIRPAQVTEIMNGPDMSSEDMDCSVRSITLPLNKFLHDQSASTDAVSCFQSQSIDVSGKPSQGRQNSNMSMTMLKPHLDELQEDPSLNSDSDKMNSSQDIVGPSPYLSNSNSDESERDSNMSLTTLPIKTMSDNSWPVQCSDDMDVTAENVSQSSQEVGSCKKEDSSSNYLLGLNILTNDRTTEKDGDEMKFTACSPDVDLTPDQLFDSIDRNANVSFIATPVKTIDIPPFLNTPQETTLFMQKSLALMKSPTLIDDMGFTVKNVSGPRPVDSYLDSSCKISCSVVQPGMGTPNKKCQNAGRVSLTTTPVRLTVLPPPLRSPTSPMQCSDDMDFTVPNIFNPQPSSPTKKAIEMAEQVLTSPISEQQGTDNTFFGATSVKALSIPPHMDAPTDITAPVEGSDNMDFTVPDIFNPQPQDLFSSPTKKAIAMTEQILASHISEQEGTANLFSGANSVKAISIPPQMDAPTDIEAHMEGSDNMDFTVPNIFNPQPQELSSSPTKKAINMAEQVLPSPISEQEGTDYGFSGATSVKAISIPPQMDAPTDFTSPMQCSDDMDFTVPNIFNQQPQDLPSSPTKKAINMEEQILPSPISEQEGTDNVFSGATSVQTISTPPQIDAPTDITEHMEGSDNMDFTIQNVSNAYYASETPILTSVNLEHLSMSIPIRVAASTVISLPTEGSDDMDFTVQNISKTCAATEELCSSSIENSINLAESVLAVPNMEHQTTVNAFLARSPLKVNPIPSFMCTPSNNAGLMEASDDMDFTVQNISISCPATQDLCSASTIKNSVNLSEPVLAVPNMEHQTTVNPFFAGSPGKLNPIPLFTDAPANNTRLIKGEGVVARESSFDKYMANTISAEIQSNTENGEFNSSLENCNIDQSKHSNSVNCMPPVMTEDVDEKTRQAISENEIASSEVEMKEGKMLPDVVLSFEGLGQEACLQKSPDEAENKDKEINDVINLRDDSTTPPICTSLSTPLPHVKTVSECSVTEDENNEAANIQGNEHFLSNKSVYEINSEGVDEKIDLAENQVVSLPEVPNADLHLVESFILSQAKRTHSDSPLAGQQKEKKTRLSNSPRQIMFPQPLFDARSDSTFTNVCSGHTVQNDPSTCTTTQGYRNLSESLVNKEGRSLSTPLQGGNIEMDNIMTPQTEEMEFSSCSEERLIHSKSKMITPESENIQPELFSNSSVSANVSKNEGNIETDNILPSQDKAKEFPPDMLTTSESKIITPELDECQQELLSIACLNPNMSETQGQGTVETSADIRDNQSHNESCQDDVNKEPRAIGPALSLLVSKAKTNLAEASVVCKSVPNITTETTKLHADLMIDTDHTISKAAASSTPFRLQSSVDNKSTAEVDDICQKTYQINKTADVVDELTYKISSCAVDCREDTYTLNRDLQAKRAHSDSPIVGQQQEKRTRMSKSPRIKDFRPSAICYDEPFDSTDVEFWEKPLSNTSWNGLDLSKTTNVTSESLEPLELRSRSKTKTLTPAVSLDNQVRDQLLMWSKERDCLWQLESFDLADFDRNEGKIVLKFTILKSEIALNINYSKQGTICKVISLETSLIRPVSYQTAMQQLVTSFGFEAFNRCVQQHARKLKSNFEELPYVMMSFNMFNKTLTRVLEQTLIVLGGYAGSRLVNNQLRFRVISYSLQFICTIGINLDHLLDFGRPKIVFEHAGGWLNEDSINEILDSHWQGENPMLTFIKTVVAHIVKLEIGVNFVTRRPPLLF